MSLIRKRLAAIERELSLGHGEAPESMLNGLLQELSPADLEAEHESVLRLLHQFGPKRKKRLLGKLESTAEPVNDNGTLYGIN